MTKVKNRSITAIATNNRPYAVVITPKIRTKVDRNCMRMKIKSIIAPIWGKLWLFTPL